MKFQEYTTTFLNIKKSEVKKSTYCNYANNLKQINKYIGNENIEKIKTENIEKMCIKMIEDGYSYKTLTDMKMITKSVLKQARKSKLTNEIIDTINIPKNLIEIAKSRTKKEVEIYNKEETKLLLDNLLSDCNNVDLKIKKVAIGTLILMQTGARIGELCALQWKDVNLKERYIDINKTVQRLTAPNQKSQVIIGSPKSATSKRKVPITDVLYEILEKEQREEELYIVSVNENNVTEPRTFRREYTKYLEKIKLRYLHPHALRHCFASNLINNGVNVKYASQILGHSNSGITLDVYTHTTQTELIQVANKINNNTEQKVNSQQVKFEQSNITGLLEILKDCKNVVININTGPIYNNYGGDQL